MVRTKLKKEVIHYIGIPYFTNLGKYKNHRENVFVGKGTAKEIALKTVELANEQKVKLLNFTPEQIYNFQKKNHLGIDCSGLACHLLNYYFGLNLNPRRTSADMLTSPPLSVQIDVSQAATGDLIRQQNGRHVLFILEKVGSTIYYVDSSRAKRGVNFGEIQTSSTSLQSVHRILKDQ